MKCYLLFSLFHILYWIMFIFPFSFVFLWTGFRFDFCLSIFSSVTFLAYLSLFKKQYQSNAKPGGEREVVVNFKLFF